MGPDKPSMKLLVPTRNMNAKIFRILIEIPFNGRSEPARNWRLRESKDVRVSPKLSAGRALVCAVMPFIAVAAKAPAQSLSTRHVRKEIASGEAYFIRRLPASQSLRLDIALPLRNQSALEDLLQKLYDPQSPLFHQFLSVAEFTERFGPTEEDYAAVIRFAEQNGLRVTGMSANRVILNVAGSVANIERAFQVTMASYQHPTEPRTFYSPDREPSAAGLTVP